MRLCVSVPVCLLATCALLPAAQGAELTLISSSFEKERPVGFRVGASYSYTYKTAMITRESLPYFQSPSTMADVLANYRVPAGQSLSRTEVIPDLIYTQRRQTLTVGGFLGIVQAIQLGVELPLVLVDERQYDLDPRAGWNRCNIGSWGCIAASSSTYLDGIYPIEPADQTGSLIFRPPLRGGSGADMIDTLNISLTGSPLYQKRDPSKPTWVIGVEAQISIGTIMQYDVTRLRLPADSKLVEQSVLNSPEAQRGWNGVSEGLHRFILRTALSRRFRTFDPYFGLWYMLPVPRTEAGSPWQTDYGFQQKRSMPQHKAGVTFGTEIIPLENKAKGHRLSIDLRGALNVSFLGRGYSEAWELLAASNALICDDETALPPPFNYQDNNARPGITGVTQGTFNPACRAPLSQNIPGDTRARLVNPSPSYRQPYSGLTAIADYVSFTADLGVVLKLFRHLRLRAAFTYQRDQGHVITMDDAGTTNYADRNSLNGGRACIPNRVDLNCPVDWNPLYRAVINQPGRRYRVDDVNVFGGSAMLQVYY
ncbi:MAG: hypothetical protein RMK29_10405 [Myxococcales bacterium]|nr:hypothetical protein [Myxococcota bacterium]MDW8282114.1 hypothetical protein [Myxococcales bacterium]